MTIEFVCNGELFSSMICASAIECIAQYLLRLILKTVLWYVLTSNHAGVPLSLSDLCSDRSIGLIFNIGQNTIDLLGSSGEVGQSAVRMWLAWLVAWWLADLWQSYVFDSGVYGLLTLVTYYSPSAES